MKSESYTEIVVPLNKRLDGQSFVDGRNSIACLAFNVVHVEDEQVVHGHFMLVLVAEGGDVYASASVRLLRVVSCKKIKQK